MFRKSTIISVLLLSLVLSAAAVPRAMGAEPLAPAIEWVPDDALLVVELTDSEALLQTLLSPEAISAVTSNPAYKHGMRSRTWIELRKALGQLTKASNDL